MRTTMGYSPERKEAVLKKMLPPNNQSIAGLAKEEGISDATLYNWRQQARNEGRLMPDSDNTPEGWTSKDKFAAVMETAAMSEAEIAEYCRQRGLYPEQLASWRAACEQANDWHRASEKQLKIVTRADRKKVRQLEKELARKEKALAEAAALLVLGKKLDAMFEDPEGE
jgi:transposase-like protein